MERDGEPEQAAADGDQLRRDGLPDAEVDVDPGQQGDADGEQQQHQLDVAAGARHHGLHGGDHGAPTAGTLGATGTVGGVDGAGTVGGVDGAGTVGGVDGAGDVTGTEPQASPPAAC